MVRIRREETKTKRLRYVVGALLTLVGLGMMAAHSVKFDGISALGLLTTKVSAETGVGCSELVVAPGDTLGHIAQKHLGHARIWPLLRDANRDLLRSTSQLHVGMTLRVPIRPR